MKGCVQLASEQTSQENLTYRKKMPLIQGLMVWGHQEST